MEYRILIVDDNEPAINIMIDMLLTLGISNVTKASHGKSALAKTQFQKFDMIICDLNMPIMNGLEFFQNATQGELINNTPFLMVSAENEKSEIIKALSSGISDYLVKPFSHAMFAAKVKKLLNLSTDIPWSADLALGNEILDNDHKYLVTLVNTINLAIDCNISLDDLMAYASLLEAHCKNHFQREEDLMVKIGSPGLVQHRADHEALLNHIREMCGNIKSKRSLEEFKESIPFIELMSGWILKDILDHDKKLKEYFIKVNRSNS